MLHFGQDVILLRIYMTAPAGYGMIINRSHIIYMGSGCTLAYDQACSKYQGNGSEDKYGLDSYHSASSSY
jgi:hypothetical protein